VPQNKVTAAVSVRKLPWTKNNFYKKSQNR